MAPTPSFHSSLIALYALIGNNARAAARRGDALEDRSDRVGGIGSRD
jgi:hypothetical protein